MRNENNVTITFANTNGDIIFNTTGTVAYYLQGSECYFSIFESNVTAYLKNIKVKPKSVRSLSVSSELQWLEHLLPFMVQWNSKNKEY